MNEREAHEAELFGGLRELSVGAFPKTCANCGRVYPSLQDFLARTEAIAGRRSLKGSLDDDDRPIVELFRNCVCGSTLMDVCVSRRDESEAGQRRREKFDRMLDLLVERGVEREMARAELRKVVNGGKSALLEQVLRTIR